MRQPGAAAAHVRPALPGAAGSLLLVEKYIGIGRTVGRHENFQSVVEILGHREVARRIGDTCRSRQIFAPPSPFRRGAVRFHIHSGGLLPVAEHTAALVGCEYLQSAALIDLHRSGIIAASVESHNYRGGGLDGQRHTSTCVRIFRLPDSGPLSAGVDDGRATERRRHFRRIARHAVPEQNRGDARFDKRQASGNDRHTRRVSARRSLGLIDDRHVQVLPGRDCITSQAELTWGRARNN